MAALGTRSLERLAGVKPVTLARAKQLADFATSRGMDITIADFGGLRDEATQKLLVKWRDDSVSKGGPWYPVAPPGKSNHASGDAFDIDILLYNGKRYREDEYAPDAAYKVLADYAPTIGLRAGYYFAKSDPFHFENVEVSASGPKRAGEIAGGVLLALAALLILLLLSGTL